MNKFLFTACIFLAFSFLSVHGQKNEIFSKTVHLSIQKATVQQLLEEIQSKTGVHIEYTSSFIALQNQIELDRANYSIGSALKMILGNQPVTCVEKNHKIILTPASEPMNWENILPHYKFYGLVKDESSNEPMAEANISEDGFGWKGVTNKSGYFSIDLAEGFHQLDISYTGFENSRIFVSINGDVRTDIKLQNHTKLDTVLIQQSVATLPSTAGRYSKDTLQNIRLLSPDIDPMRSIFLFPGISSNSGNFGNLTVRGGSPDENLFLLDGSRIFDPSHMLGAVSVVNPTLFKSLSFYKSDIPAEFYGALSSIIDVSTVDGNLRDWHGEVNASVLAGAASLQGPLFKDGTGLAISYRHSWVTPVWTQFQNNLNPEFYDVEAKLTQLVGKRDKVQLHYYQSEDDVRQTATNTNNLHQWSNQTGSLRWDHLIGSRTIWTTFFNLGQFTNYNSYKYAQINDSAEEVSSSYLNAFSSIQQFNFRTQGEIYLNKRNRLKVGAIYDQISVVPSVSNNTAHSEENDHPSSSNFQPLTFSIFGGFLEWNFQLNRKFVFRPGVHVSDYQYGAFSNVSIQPRLYTAWQFVKGQFLYATYSHMAQFIHYLVNPYFGFNGDIWLPSSDTLKPELSHTFTLGYWLKPKKTFGFSIDGYWKLMQNITNYAEGKSYWLNNSNWQQNVVGGQGWSYGVESSLFWQAGKFSTQVAYTLSWSWRQFPGINSGQPFPYKYDRRHVIGWGAGYHFNRHFDFSAMWTFMTGAVLSGSSPQTSSCAGRDGCEMDDLFQRYQFQYHYDPSAQYRSANYQRFDGALIYHTPISRKFSLSISGGVYFVAGDPDQFSSNLVSSTSNSNLNVNTQNLFNGWIPFAAFSLRF